MLALLGFLTIATFLTLILTKRLTAITALVLIPIITGLIAGFNPTDLGKFALEGIKQVAPTGVLLMFAILYFSIMLDAGLYDPIIDFIVKSVKGDPLKVVVGTSILTMIVHIAGDGTSTFLIVLSAVLVIYKELKINRVVLSSIVALSVGPLHLVPWSGPSARAISAMKSDAVHIFNPNIPSMMGGILWVLFVAYWFGKKERKRLGVVDFQYQSTNNLTEEQRTLKRSKLLWVNALMTIGLFVVLLKGWIPTPVLFVVAGMLAIIINYPKVSNQQKILMRHGATIFFVTSIIFAAGVFSGILTGTKMIEAMATSLVSLIPQQHANLLPVLTGITSLPCSLLFTPDAYYFGVVPVLSQTATQLGIDNLEIGRAALLGQMTVGFPISPLTASTFLLVGMCEVDLGEHQRHTFFWAWGTTIVMTLIALLSGSIHI